MADLSVCGPCPCAPARCGRGCAARCAGATTAHLPGVRVRRTSGCCAAAARGGMDGRWAGAGPGGRADIVHYSFLGPCIHGCGAGAGPGGRADIVHYSFLGPCIDGCWAGAGPGGRARLERGVGTRPRDHAHTQACRHVALSRRLVTSPCHAPSRSRSFTGLSLQPHHRPFHSVPLSFSLTPTHRAPCHSRTPSLVFHLPPALLCPRVPSPRAAVHGAWHFPCWKTVR